MTNKTTMRVLIVWRRTQQNITLRWLLVTASYKANEYELLVVDVAMAAKSQSCLVWCLIASLCRLCYILYCR